MSNDAPSHVVPLDHGWSLWRWFALRGAGFPAEQVLALGSPQTSRAMDDVLAAEAAVDEAATFALAVISTSPESLLPAELVRLQHAIKARKPISEAAVAPSINAAVERYAEALKQLASAQGRSTAIFEQASQQLSAVLRQVAADDRYREAVAWQNRNVLHNTLNSLLSRPATARDADSRRKELLVASYLQRYCMKNDTIGFFGPSVFGDFTSDGEPLVSRPGPGLVRRRKVELEYWAVDALATALSRHPDLRPSLCPRLHPTCRLEGSSLVTPFGTHEMSPSNLALLRGCDGTRSAAILARTLAGQPGLDLSGPEQVMAAINRFEQMGLLLRKLDVAPQLPPFVPILKAQLEDLPTSSARDQALEALARLEAARAALAEASGDSVKVDAALEALENTFTELTGQAATRSAGQLYAGRTLAYEDCRRDIEVALGPMLREELAAPLSLVLTSCRWFTHHVSRQYLESLRHVHQVLRQETGSERVDLLTFSARATSHFKQEDTEDNPGARASVHEFQARWARLLGIPTDARRITRTARDLMDAARDLFSAPGPGWPTARYHSPDVLIAASGPEAVARGDFSFVLGEIHAGYNQLENSVAFGEHPSPEDFLAALDADHPQGRVRAIQETSHGLRLALLNLSRHPGNVDWEYSATRSARPAAQVVPASELVILENAGRFVVSTRDGRLSWDGLGFLDAAMGEKRLDFLPSLPHAPRVTIDRLVLCREAWRFSASELPFAQLGTPAERFLGARRWVQQRGLPRFGFVRASAEHKPVYVDLESPVYVEMLGKLVRRSTELMFTELLPGPDECWLADSQGRRYTSELRMVAVDPIAWKPT